MVSVLPEDKSSSGLSNTLSEATPGQIVALGIGLLVILAAVLSLLLRPESLHERDSETPAMAQGPTQGVACVELAQAMERRARGDVDAFARAVRAASRRAQSVLDTSGQLFGRPERIALQLDAMVERLGPGHARLSRPLEQARKVCMRLGAWRNRSS
jgi:hypothetical protein